MIVNNVFQHGKQAYHTARMMSDYPVHLVIYALALKFLEKGLAASYPQASMMASSWLMVYQSTQNGEQLFQETRQWLELNASTAEQQVALAQDQMRMQSMPFIVGISQQPEPRLQ